MADIIQAAQKQIDEAAKEIKPDTTKPSGLPPVPPVISAPTPEALMGKPSGTPAPLALTEKTETPHPSSTGQVALVSGLPSEPPPLAAKDTDTISSMATAKLVDSLIHQQPVPAAMPPQKSQPLKTNAIPSPPQPPATAAWPLRRSMRTATAISTPAWEHCHPTRSSTRRPWPTTSRWG